MKIKVFSVTMPPGIDIDAECIELAIMNTTGIAVKVREHT